MFVSIKLWRSECFVRSERIKTGENVPEEFVVHVRTEDISEDLRAFLLAANHGSYSTKDYEFRRDGGGKWTNSTYYAWNPQKPIFDGYDPSPAEVEAAINAMIAVSDAELTARHEEEEARKAEAARIEAEKAAAREILAGEIGRLTRDRDYYREKYEEVSAELERLQSEPETETEEE